MQSPSETKRFRERLIADTRRAVTAAHDEMVRLRSAGQPATDQNLAYALAAMAALHAHAGDAEALRWLREDVLWLVDSVSGTSESDTLPPQPAFPWFRLLQPFCEAYRHLRDGGHLSADERER